MFPQKSVVEVYVFLYALRETVLFIFAPPVFISDKFYLHKMFNMRPKHKLEYALLRSVIFFLNLLPVQAILFLCSTIGYIAWIVFPFRLNVAYKNLSTVFPEMDRKAKLRLMKKVYLQFTKTFGLVFILHRKSLLNLIKNAEVTGLEEIKTSLEDGKGIILTTIHGSWFEAYFAWFNIQNLPTSLIYQKQSNPLSDEFFVRQRSRYGTSLQHLSSYEGMKVYQKALNDNRILIVSLDQSYTSRGTMIPFFKTPLACAKGAPILHLRTGAPVFTSVYYMDKGKLHIDFSKVDLPSYQEINEENIQDIATRAISLYEPFIRSYPEQWFSLFHRLWGKKGYPDIKRSLKQIFC